jgi:phenylalanyl-tRNA synthetase alpha chain
MSGANDPYDPKQVAALAEENVAAAVGAAEAALAGAADLDQLHDAFLAHVGDRSPLALANREIGALPPAARSEAGQRVNRARGAIRATYQARLEQLESARDARALATGYCAGRATRSPRCKN